MKVPLRRFGDREPRGVWISCSPLSRSTHATSHLCEPEMVSYAARDAEIIIIRPLLRACSLAVGSTVSDFLADLYVLFFGDSVSDFADIAEKEGGAALTSKAVVVVLFLQHDSILVDTRVSIHRALPQLLRATSNFLIKTVST
uniref:Uncharacterized protein n=1 Tax=Steinernema glaseri TaxID=37863 RepID=A0A1I7Z6G5_9BILA